MALAPAGDRFAVLVADPARYVDGVLQPRALPELLLFEAKSMKLLGRKPTYKPSFWDQGYGYLGGALAFSPDGKRVYWKSAWSCGEGGEWACAWGTTKLELLMTSDGDYWKSSEGFPWFGDVNYDGERATPDGRLRLIGGFSVGYC